VGARVDITSRSSIRLSKRWIFSKDDSGSGPARLKAVKSTFRRLKGAGRARRNMVGGGRAEWMEAGRAIHLKCLIPRTLKVLVDQY